MFPDVRSYNILHLFLFYSSIAHSKAEFYGGIGDNCILRNGGQGTCTPFHRCFQAITDIQRGEYPMFCSFTCHGPAICCPDLIFTKDIFAEPPKMLTSVTTEAVTTSNTEKPYENITPHITDRDTFSVAEPKLREDVVSSANRKAISKCLEYSKSVYVPDPKSTDKSPKLVRECGFNTKPPIVGGHAADPREFPHMAILGYVEENGETSWLCGGSLISPDYILTSAHCTRWREKNVSPVVVRLGVMNLTNPNEFNSMQEVKITQIINHPNYTRTKRYNDIALLKLERDVIFNPYIRPACLHEEFPIDTEFGITTGWGKTSVGDEKGTDYLMEVALTIVSYDRCNKTYQSVSKIKLEEGLKEETQLCAGEFFKMKDTCNGDSGGPLIIRKENVDCMYSIIGIVSFGVQCGYLPGIYTRVSYYVPWIENIVWA